MSSDYQLEDTVFLPFTTRAFATGIPTVLAGTPAIDIYEDATATPIITGETLVVSLNSVVGFNMITVTATAATGFEAGKSYTAIIEQGTVGGVSVVGEVVAHFTLDMSAAAKDLANATDGLTALAADIATAQADLDIITGAAGALLDTTATSAQLVDDVHDEALEDHVTEGTSGYVQMLSAYTGSDGPGIYIDSGAANTNTVKGTDGTESNPVSTFAAARTLADGVGLMVYYLEGNSDITLAATHVDWQFIGIGAVADNIINLGSQDVSRAMFRNLTIEGTQGGSGRLAARDCLLQDPGAGTTTLHIFAERCGLVDDVLVDTSADNIFDACYDGAASGATPIITATGASGSIVIGHYSGKLELKSLSASHNIRLDGIGHIIFNADCNVNADVDVHGVWEVTDNTAGITTLASADGLINIPKINAECDTAISDAALATAANLALVDTVVDAIKAVTDLLPDAGALSDLALILVDTDTTIPGLIAALNDLAASDILTTALTESYAADGSTGTLTQILYLIQQSLHEFAIASTTRTVKKLDGAATAATFTLDDDTNPTSTTRAT